MFSGYQHNLPRLANHPENMPLQRYEIDRGLNLDSKTKCQKENQRERDKILRILPLFNNRSR
jgi:hypothetical protein